MNVFKKCLGISLAAMLLISCSKDDKDLPSGGNSLLHSETKINGVLSMRHEYNNQNQRTAYHVYDANNNGAYTGTIQYQYNPQGLLSAVFHKGDDGQLLTTEQYSYTTGNNPSSMLQTIADGTSISWQYQYTDDQFISTAHVAQTGETFVFNYTYDEDENLIMMRSDVGGIVTQLEMGNYDNKFNVYKNGEPFHWLNKGNHNHQSEKFSLINLERNLVYTYNEAGYPTKTSVYDAVTNQLVEERTHTYIAAQ